MAANPKTYTGRNATIKIASGGATLEGDEVFALSDFSLTLDKGTVEQELLGEEGNFFTAGALSADGSLTSAKLGSGAAGKILGAMVNGTKIQVSGCVADSSSLAWYFKSAQVTGFDISIGDANTISEGSIDFSVLDTANISKTRDTKGRVWIVDNA